jgi:hypothetical protein
VVQLKHQKKEKDLMCSLIMGWNWWCEFTWQKAVVRKYFWFLLFSCISYIFWHCESYWELVRIFSYYNVGLMPC